MSLNSNQFKKFALIAAKKADEKKAEEITLLDLRKSQVSVSDYVLILSGNSDVHVKALKDEIEKEFDQYHLNPTHRDGFKSGHWMVLDYGGLMIHIFHEESRVFYSLERLWEDAKIVHWNGTQKPREKTIKKRLTRKKK